MSHYMKHGWQKTPWSCPGCYIHAAKMPNISLSLCYSSSPWNLVSYVSNVFPDWEWCSGLQAAAEDKWATQGKRNVADYYAEPRNLARNWLLWRFPSGLCSWWQNLSLRLTNFEYSQLLGRSHPWIWSNWSPDSWDRSVLEFSASLHLCSEWGV